MIMKTSRLTLNLCSIPSALMWVSEIFLWRSDSKRHLQGWKYTVWKFYTSFKWSDLPGPVVIIPICDISKSACSTPGGPLVYGIMRKINGDALVHPSLAAVFVVPPIKSSS